ncbi:uncharacterized protein LOC121997139 isoform X1 [Zingiber officinale]|uniref:uncharacterized protein LOC121997139 isoform X1 n=1 Tax=Zingiber officinale TaxID=94328 RepID=UPI001C4D0DF5|nr:uncharacterized protein LOC121997139 isoform X1 [Zingiber officinale]
MGKRKERRLAAMKAASRRVKLDLFAEPSGEMVTSSVHDEVGEDPDKDCQAEVPNSPSSSGKKKENPLSLLEQYSDDELDEESSKHPIQSAEENVSIDPLVQETVSVDVIAENKTNNVDDAVGLNDGQLGNTNNIESNDTIESDIASTAAQVSKGAPESQPVLDASGMQVVGDLAGSWKVVMHEQSNQYYYWNTATGETSWEVPHGLSLEVPTNGVNLSSTVEGQVNYPVLLQANIPVSNMHGGISSSIEPYGTVEMINTNGQKQATSNALLDYSRSSADLTSYEAEHTTKISEFYAMTDVQPASLVEYAQNLLHRLKTLPSCVDGHEWIAKEIELRISDCKALSSYGSSLIPFWWHIETQLKQLESVIAGAEVSSIPDESTVVNVGPSRIVEENTTLYNGETRCSIPDIDTNVMQTEPDMKKPENEDTACLGFTGVRTNICEETVNSIIKAELPTEDVDMDVEMEVDDETVAFHPTYQTTESPVPVEPTGQVGPASVSHPDEPNVPPPPDEEWIPPPPPDNEVIPPPPPEDPPEPSYPPPYADVLPPPPQDQYSLGYVLPSYNYYAPNGSEVTNLNYYMQGDGSQIVEAPQPYYEPVVSSTYPEIAVHVNQVEPMTYYDVSGGSVSHIPVVSGTASTGFYVEASAVSYGNVSSLNQAISVGPSSMESANKSVSPGKHDSDVSAVFKETSKSSLSAISDTSGVQIASKDLMNGSTMVAPPVSNKNKSKVLRTRKATIAVAPSLRSNKKVSSLVDKWKAAKEELHGEDDDDDEPVDALEILEKKRQKEIKEWHARQIATGEAQDNANFLPLGGDWRERVKRRRVEAAKSDVVESVSDAATDNAKKLPDLTELSKDLPSGWQAYWDESSKEVYYGNSITSETTWVRPTR